MPRVPWRRAPWILLLLIAAILAITWPWAKHFPDDFLRHWDPPFHAWKLEYAARTILAGHLLPPDGNTNVYYPHSGTFYFEALHWPQALVAAPLFGLFHASPVLVYHLVLVLFWALAGLCLWMLLLALGATRRAALLGALIFTIMPYRLSYMVEFNMQLCFGLPLFFFFMVRFFQHPSLRYACGLALAWWLQAVSELYQAVFLLLILPFPGFALLVARKEWLRSFRRFWLPALGAAVLGGVLSAVFLGPYLTMLNVHAVNRNLQEIATHILEPLSYLRPGGRFHFLHSLDARRDEMIVYPTAAVMLLAAAHLAFDARRLAHIPAPRWIWACRAIRWTALLGFLGLTFFIYRFGGTPGITPIYSVLPVVAALSAFLVLLHPEERDTSSLFVTGLFAGAVFAFFMSLGPTLTIRHTGFTSVNYLYLGIYKHLDALQGFRVVSRFSIFLLLFLVVAAALAWSRIERQWLPRRLRRWLWLLPVLAVAAESLPSDIFRIREVKYPLTSATLDWLDNLGQPSVIAMVPMGDRNYDSWDMLQVARTDRLFVYAWGGAYPRYTTEVRTALDAANLQPARTAELLRQLWPECFILEDKYVSRWKSSLRCRFAHVLSNETDVVAQDARFALLRLKPQTTPAAEQLKLIRGDYLRANSFIRFRARTAAGSPAATLWLDANGYPLGRWEIGPDARDFEGVVPSRYILPLLPNRLRFHAAGEAPFILDAFQPAPAPAKADAAVLPDLECPPWVGHLHEVPASAIPLEIQYRNGFEYLACEPFATNATIGGTLALRHYLRASRDMQAAVNMHVQARLRGADGTWIETGVTLADQGDLNDVRCQAHPGSIYALEAVMEIPARLAPGDCKLSIVLRNQHGHRLTGRHNGKSVKEIPVPVTIRLAR